MARRQPNPLHPPPDGEGGYEFEVVQIGQPTYFGSRPAVKARGGLQALGDGEGLLPRPAPVSPARSTKKSERMTLRTFIARFQNPEYNGIEQVTIQGHELRYIPGKKYKREMNPPVVQVLLHLPAGTITVAVFQLHDLLGLFEGHTVDSPPS